MRPAVASVAAAIPAQARAVSLLVIDDATDAPLSDVRVSVAGDPVERVTDPTDGRARIVRLTERGWMMHETAGEIVRGLEADWAARLGGQKLDRLRQLLKELIAALDA